MRKFSAGFLVFFIFFSVISAQPRGQAGGPPSFSGGNPAPPPSNGSKGPPPGGRSGPPPGRNPGSNQGSSSSSSGGFSASDPNYNLWNYRGKRTSSVSAPLEVVEKSVVFIKNKLQLVIQFNQAVNPVMLTASSIFLNDSSLPDETKIKFNRKADSVTLTFIDDFISKEDLESAAIILRDIQTFDGKSVKELIVK